MTGVGQDERTAAADTGATDDAPITVVTTRAVRRRGESWTSRVVPPAVLGAALIGLWYFITYLVLDEGRRFLMRPPHDVLQVGFFEWDNLKEMLDALLVTSRVALIGLAISIVLGMLVAVAMSQTRTVERAVFPFMVMLQAIPILAITPLIGFWFKYGTNSRVIVCVIISLFPIIVNTLFGLQSADREMHDLFTLQHAGRLTRLRKLMFPAALPAIFAGMRISAGLSVIGAIVGDFFFGQGTPGIGQQLRKHASQLNGEQLFATVIVSCLLGVAVFLVFGWLQTLFTSKWHESTGRTR
jgi:NitT/TauT family transport system permease protein